MMKRMTGTNTDAPSVLKTVLNVLKNCVNFVTSTYLFFEVHRYNLQERVTDRSVLSAFLFKDCNAFVDYLIFTQSG